MRRTGSAGAADPTGGSDRRRRAGRARTARGWLGLVPLALATAAVADGVPPALVERAAEAGRVRVIVELAEPAWPEGGLDASGRTAQRLRVADAQARLRDRLSGLDLARFRAYPVVPFAALELGPVALAALGRDPRVRAVVEDRPSRPSLDVSVGVVEADQAAAIGFDGTGEVIVVLDTGVDGGHQNFPPGKIVAEACFADGVGPPPSSGDCPGGGNTAFGPGAGVPCDYHDECFHGTHVAGIAAGDGPLYSGVAPGAGLVPIQVFSEFGASYCGGSGTCPLSWTSDQDLALAYVYDTLRLAHPIAAVNMSLGDGAYTSQAACDANRPSTRAWIDQLRSVGIATVVSAGNDSCSGTGCTAALSTPACLSPAVSVSATRDDDSIPSFANRAPFLSLYAPGVSIRAPLYHSTNQYTNASGTSMAAPHVAGAFAILRQAFPGASVGTLLAALQTSGVPRTYASRIRIRAALSELGITACQDGVDDDGDGLVDLADPGCDSASDPDETSAALACDNALDDDGDGLVDTADPGCRDPGWVSESPACQDGLDNDGDGGVDWDGQPADVQCTAPWKTSERNQRCGLGAELALALVPWAGWRGGRRRRRSRSRTRA